MSKKKEVGFSESVIDTYRNGTAEQRDALRVIANSVVHPDMCFKYENSTVPSLVQALAIVGAGEFRIPFSGEKAQIAPDDVACSLDSLLKAEYANSFAGLLENIAVTLIYTATENFRSDKQPAVWNLSTNHNAELIRRAFAYWVAQEGLCKLLKNPEPIWHTKLPVFFISVFEKDSDYTDGSVLSYSLFDMFGDQAQGEHQFAARQKPLKPLKPASLDLDGDEDEEADEEETSYFDPDTTLLSIRTELPLVVKETVGGNRTKGSSNRLNYTDVPCIWHPIADKECENTFWSISLVSRGTSPISICAATTTEALKIAAAISAFEA